MSSTTIVTATTVTNAGPKARRASAIERAQIDGPGLEFADQQGGDEIPDRQKNTVTPTKPSIERPSRGVLAEDQKNCHGTDPIQARMVRNGRA
jgi:hypothetical protein